MQQDIKTTYSCDEMAHLGRFDARESEHPTKKRHKTGFGCSETVVLRHFRLNCTVPFLSVHQSSCFAPLHSVSKCLAEGMGRNSNLSVRPLQNVC